MCSAGRRILVLMLVLGLAELAPLRGGQESFGAERRRMVDEQLRRRGIRHSALLHAMEAVPRHLFVPEAIRSEAYRDEPLPAGIDGGDGLLQPYMTALMIELLRLDGTQKVLEIGTGSGYDAAILSRLARQVYTVEISPERGEAARERLERLGYENVHVRIGDGAEGWPSKAPFDAIILTTAPEEIPRRLIEQLSMNGRMVVAVGSVFQDLMLLTKTPEGLQKRRIEPVRMGSMSEERSDVPEPPPSPR